MVIKSNVPKVDAHAKKQNQHSNGSARRVQTNRQTHRQANGWTLPSTLPSCFANYK